MRAPLISVIVPTYRRSAYLADTLNSVFSQTLRDFELIVVEDGSRDAAETLALYGDRVQHLWQPHQGVGAARNFGASRARGEWFAFVDDDDLWLPEKLERQVAAFEHEREMGMFHTDHYVQIDGKLKVPLRTPPRDRVPTGWVGPDLFLNNFIVMSSVMIRKAAFTQVGGFSTTTRFAADLELWLRLARVCPIGFVAERLTIYRDQDHSLSSELRWHVAFATMMSNFVHAHPEIYREVGRDAVRRQLRDINWRGAYAHLQQHRYATAARLFASAWSWAPRDLKPLLYAAACLTGRRGVGLLRGAKKMIG
jgi:glycosyltransferase involved in cell wall biosynthesis